MVYKYLITNYKIKLYTDKKDLNNKNKLKDIFSLLLLVFLTAGCKRYDRATYPLSSSDCICSVILLGSFFLTFMPSSSKALACLNKLPLPVVSLFTMPS